MNNIFVWMIAALSWTAVAHASPITFSFTGTVTDVPVNETTAIVNPGDAIVGTYTFESTAADSAAGSQEGSYTSPPGAPYGLAVTVGGNGFGTSDFLNIGVANFAVGGDFYTVLACSPDAGCADREIEIFLQDLDGTTLSSEALPLAPPPLGAFEIRGFHLFAVVDGNQLQIDGTTNTLTCTTCVPTAVPVPATLALLTVGLALCCVLGRRHTHMRRSTGMTTRTLIGLVVLFTAISTAPAGAVDGTKLIDHAKALAGGTTPGDAAGYPVTISQPGSYRLSSNLLQPDPNTDVIVITASNVTLDLNGFAILGATECSADRSPTCVGGGSAVTILQPGRGIVGGDNLSNVTVRNGTVQGMGNAGILLIGGGILVEYVHARSNAFGGIMIRAGEDLTSSIAQHNTAQRNGRGNSPAGIFIGPGIMVERGMARYNVADFNTYGIEIRMGSASHNVVTNSFTGLSLTTVASFFGNVLFDNDFHFQPGGAINLGQNQCGSAACLNARF